PIVDRNDLHDPRENFKNAHARVGPHTRVVYTPRLALPVRPTRLGPKPIRLCGIPVWAHTPMWPTRPIWPSPVWPTWPHSHHHMAMSSAWPHILQTHGHVSHTINYKAMHMPVWRR
ncbi:hypothetical protein J1N35_004740, partial [Gossypium stocksii]